MMLDFPNSEGPFQVAYQGPFLAFPVSLGGKFLVSPCQTPKGQTRMDIWLWVKSMYPKWNPGKWKHGPKPVVP